MNVGIWLWDKDATEWRKALCDADGKLIISDVDPFEVIQATPEDLTHVPHGRVAGNGVHLPYAVDADGKLQISIAALERLADIADVTIAGLADGHFISWSDGLGYWQNRLLAEGDIPADIARDTEVATAVSDHTDILDAHTYNPLQKVRTGEYFMTMDMLDPPGTMTGYADRIYAFPLILARAMTLDAIAIHVTAGAGADMNARLGLYNDGTNLYPGTLIVDGGEIDCNATGVQAVTIDESLTKGLYWVAIVFEANTTVRAAKMYSPILGFEVADFDDPNVGWYGTQVYGAMPDPFTVGIGALYSISMPLILVKASSLD